MFLFFSCSQKSNSSDGGESLAVDTISKNSKDSTAANVTNKSPDSTKKISEVPSEFNIFERIVGRWAFVKSFLPKGQSIDDSSFSIRRVQIESAGYAYFVRFSGDEQEWLLAKDDYNTVSYSDGYGIFKFDDSTGHLIFTGGMSNAEYRKVN